MAQQTNPYPCLLSEELIIPHQVDICNHNPWKIRLKTSQLFRKIHYSKKQICKPSISHSGIGSQRFLIQYSSLWKQVMMWRYRQRVTHAG